MTESVRLVVHKSQLCGVDKRMKKWSMKITNWLSVRSVIFFSLRSINHIRVGSGVFPHGWQEIAAPCRAILLFCRLHPVTHFTTICQDDRTCRYYAVLCRDGSTLAPVLATSRPVFCRPDEEGHKGKALSSVWSKSFCRHSEVTLTFRRLTSTIVDVPQRYPPKLHFIYLFNKYRYRIF